MNKAKYTLLFQRLLFTYTFLLFEGIAVILFILFFFLFYTRFYTPVYRPTSENVSVIASPHSSTLFIDQYQEAIDFQNQKKTYAQQMAEKKIHNPFVTAPPPDDDSEQEKTPEL